MDHSAISKMTGLSFGFSTLGCPELDVAGVRALAANRSSRFVEIRALDGSLDFVGSLARFPGGAAAARDFFLEAGVRVALVGSSFQLTCAAESQRERLTVEAEAGEALGAKWLRVFGGGTWGETLMPEAAATARANRAWWEALRAARGWKIDLILEVHDAFSGSPQILDLFAQAGGPMPLLWDTHHTWKIAGETVKDSWEQLGAHIRHVHVKDSVSTPLDEHEYRYVSPGRGEFPLRGALDLLADAGFGGIISLEWEKQWHPTLPPLSAVLPDWDGIVDTYWHPSPPAVVPPTLLLKCDFDHLDVAPAAGPYFHGAREQYEDITGGGLFPGPGDPGELNASDPRLGKLRLYYEGGDGSQRWARLVSDEDDPQNRVLRFHITEPNVRIQWPDGVQRKSRVQAEIYGNVRLREFYQTVRMRLPAAAAKLREYPGKIGWFTLMEFWNNAGWTKEPHVFRFGLHLEKPDPSPGTDLYFATGAQTYAAETGFVDVWHARNTDFPVRYGEWMTLELYFREGGADQGRLHVAVTPATGPHTVLFDVRNWTHHPANPAPTGLKQCCPMKLYTSAEPVDFMQSHGMALEVDWDDLEIWIGRTPESEHPR